MMCAQKEVFPAVTNAEGRCPCRSNHSRAARLGSRKADPMRRAEFYGLRGLFAGASWPCAARASRVLRPWGRLGGRAAMRRICRRSRLRTRLEAATGRRGVWRIGGTSFGIASRPLEWGARPDRTPVVDALVADTAAPSTPLPVLRIIPRLFPREAKLIRSRLSPGSCCPSRRPSHCPQGAADVLSVSKEDEEDNTRKGGGHAEHGPAHAAKRDHPARGPAGAHMVPRTGAGGQKPARDLSAVSRTRRSARRRPT